MVTPFAVPFTVPSQCKPPCTVTPPLLPCTAPPARPPWRLGGPPPAQIGLPVHSESAQSFRPSPSSSTLLPQLISVAATQTSMVDTKPKTAPFFGLQVVPATQVSLPSQSPSPAWHLQW